MNKTKWRLEVPDFITPSYNEFRKLHWAKQEKLEKTWMLLLISAGVRDIPTVWKKKRKVTIWRESPGRVDKPNIWTPIDKLILDNLVRLDILVDDSQEWAEIEAYPVRKKPKRMVIEIEEM